MILALFIIAMVGVSIYCVRLFTKYFLKAGDAKQSDRLPTHLPCSSCDDSNCHCGLGDFDAEGKY